MKIYRSRKVKGKSKKQVKKAIIAFVKDEWDQEMNNYKHRVAEEITDILECLGWGVGPSAIKSSAQLLRGKSRVRGSNWPSVKYLTKTMEDIAKVNYVNNKFLSYKEPEYLTTELSISWKKDNIVMNYLGNYIPVHNPYELRDIIKNPKIDVFSGVHAGTEVITNDWENLEDDIKKNLMKEIMDEMCKELPIKYIITFKEGKIKGEPSLHTQGTLTLKKYSPRVEKILDRIL